MRKMKKGELMRLCVCVRAYWGGRGESPELIGKGRERSLPAESMHSKSRSFLRGRRKRRKERKEELHPSLIRESCQSRNAEQQIRNPTADFKVSQ